MFIPKYKNIKFELTVIKMCTIQIFKNDNNNNNISNCLLVFASRSQNSLESTISNNILDPYTYLDNLVNAQGTVWHQLLNNMFFGAFFIYFGGGP